MAVHPEASVTVTMYVVVVVGLTKGFDIFVALNPNEGLHEYEVPPLA